MGKKSSNPVALRDTAVDGQHFAQGDDVTGVDMEELGKAQRIGAVSTPGENDDAAEAAQLAKLAAEQAAEQAAAEAAEKEAGKAK